MLEGLPLLEDLNLFGNKITKIVSYPENLDLSPYLLKKTKGESFKYKLYGVLVHYGSSMKSGHYVSYVLSANGTWFCADDHSVRTHSEAQELTI